MTKSILSYVLLIVLIIFGLSSAEELETLFVDGEGEIYYIDGFYVDVLAKYEVKVKDLFGNGVADVEVDWEMNYEKQIAEGTPWFNKVEYLNGTTNENGYVKFIMFVKINTGPEPEEVGGPISPDDLVQNGIYICIDDDPDEPGPAGWPRYKFKNQNVQIASVPTGYSILNNPETYTTNDVAAVTYFALHSSDDLDGNGIADDLEYPLAEKFSPVLHKHSYDLQQDLSDPVYWLSNTSTKLWVYREGDGVIFNSHVSSYHHWNIWDWCTYGKGSFTGLDIRMDIPNNIWHHGAPVGSRPIFYHCYRDGESYYLQYWYFFNFNDIRNQTSLNTYHEGDWEHVSIKLNYDYYDLKFEPVAVNFYQHEGGHTKIPAECQWSQTNATQWTFQQGYDEQHTHLHIWLSANSHASYNLYDNVYNLTAIGVENYYDNCDYTELPYPNHYFEYDILKKLATNYSEWFPTTHGYSYIYHYFPIGGEDFIAFRGLFGADYWHTSVQNTTSPTSPVFGLEWEDFSIDFDTNGFGNTSGFIKNLMSSINWISDPPGGDTD